VIASGNQLQRRSAPPSLISEKTSVILIGTPDRASSLQTEKESINSMDINVEELSIDSKTVAFWFDNPS